MSNPKRSNPKRLYDWLKENGHISVDYEKFHEKFRDSTGEGSQAIYKKLRTSKLLSTSYKDFMLMYGDYDSNLDPKPNEIEISTEELQFGPQKVEEKEEEELGPVFGGKLEADPEAQKGKAKDTDSSGETISLASPEKIAKIQEYFGSANPEVNDEKITEEDVSKVSQYMDTLVKREIDSPEKIKNIQIAFGDNLIDAEKAAFNTKELDDIQSYVEKLDTFEIPTQPRTIGDRAAQAFLINMPLGLESAWESTKAFGINWIDKAVSKEIADFMISGDMPDMEFVDPLDGERVNFKDNPERYKELNKLQTEVGVEVEMIEKGKEGPFISPSDVWMVKKFKEIENIKSQMTDPGSLVKGFKEADAAELIGGTFNAIQGLISTMLPALVTRGASLGPQIITPMWVDYNTTKAAIKYADADDPIAALIENNDTDFLVPTALGIGAVALEYVGLKGISKFIAGTKVGSKIMGLSANKVAWMFTANKEGMTELGQTGLEAINLELAKGKTIVQAVKKGAEAMFSEEGLESYLQGLVGSGIMTGPSAVNQVLTRALHEDPDGHKKILRGIDAIAELKERRFRAKSKTVRDLYDKDIKAVETIIKQVLTDNNKLIKHLSPADKNKLKTILNKKDKIVKDIAELDAKVESGKISAKEAGYGKRRLNTQNIQLSQEIADIKVNIDKSKIYHDIAIAKKLSKKIGGITAESFRSADDVVAYLKKFKKEDGTEFTKAELKEYSEGQGTIFKDSEGIERIVINEDASIKAGLTTTGQHEFLHKVLGKVLKADPKLGKVLGDKLNVHVKSILGNRYDETFYAQRVKEYEIDKDLAIKKAKTIGARKLTIAKKQLAAKTITKVKYNTIKKTIDSKIIEITQKEFSIVGEENLTLLSEALTSGDVVLNDSNRNFFQKVGELLRRFAQKLGLTNIKLETGEDIVRFLKDYNRGFEKGSLNISIIKFTKQTKLQAKEDIKSAVENPKGPGYNNIRQSKKHRDEYIARLKKARPELKGKKATEQVDAIFTFLDKNIIENKKSKFEKLALHYTLKGNLILPEDGYKLIEAERLATAKKIDPFSYDNPNVIIETFVGEIKIKRVDPNTIFQFKNKKVITTEVGETTIYDVDNTKAGQIATRLIIDSHFGKKSNPWCLAARQPANQLVVTGTAAEVAREEARLKSQEGWVQVGTDSYTRTGVTLFDNQWEQHLGEDTVLNQAYKYWNDYGSDKKIAFQNGNLIAFRDGTSSPQWWDRMDEPTKGIPAKGKKNSKGLTPKGEINSDTGEFVIKKFERGQENMQDGLREVYDADMNLLIHYFKKDGKKEGMELLTFELTEEDDEWVSTEQPVYHTTKGKRVNNERVGTYHFAYKSEGPMPRYNISAEFEVEEVDTHKETITYGEQLVPITPSTKAIDGTEKMKLVGGIEVNRTVTIEGTDQSGDPIVYRAEDDLVDYVKFPVMKSINGIRYLSLYDLTLLQKVEEYGKNEEAQEAAIKSINGGWTGHYTDEMLDAKNTLVKVDKNNKPVVEEVDDLEEYLQRGEDIFEDIETEIGDEDFDYDNYYARLSKTTRKDLYERTDDIYANNDPITAGFLIADAWRRQTMKKLNSIEASAGGTISGLDADSKQLVVDEALTASGSQSITGLMKAFKPGTPTEDGKGIVSIAGYLNLWLPRVIRYQMKQLGIGIKIEEGGIGFTADLTEVSKYIGEESSEGLIDTAVLEVEDRKTKYPKMKDAVDLESHPKLKEDIEHKLSRNISSAIKFYNIPKTKNQKTDSFIAAIKKGMQTDELSTKFVRKFVQEYGPAKFIIDMRTAIIGNFTTSYMSGHRFFFRKGIQKSINGIWTSPDLIQVDNGADFYDWRLPDGTLIPNRHPSIGRMGGDGTTSGHHKIRRHSNITKIISEQDMLDYMFSGPQRKVIPQSKMKGLTEQFISEMGFEVFEDQMLSGSGPVWDSFSSRIQLTKNPTLEEIAKAEEEGKSIREDIAGVLSERAIRETIKDMDRGGVKQSKVNKTGFNWFDRPRIDMVNYLASLEDNVVRELVVDGKIISEDFSELKETMKEAYDMYLGMLEYRDTWAEVLTDYANSFVDKKFKSFEDFVESTKDQVSSSIDGMLGLRPGQTSFGKKNNTAVQLTKEQGVEAYMNERISEAKDKGAEIAKMIKILIGATTGSLNTSLYHNTPGFFHEVVVPMAQRHGVAIMDFKLETVETGTTITYKGNKITSNYTKGLFSEDLFIALDALAEDSNFVPNEINLKERKAEAKEAANLYMDYIGWIANNKAALAPSTIGMMLKGFQGRSRSIAHIMHPLTDVMLGGTNEMDGYIIMPTIPAKYVTQTAINYILQGNKEAHKELRKAVDEGESMVMPKAIARVIDQFHHNTPKNDFTSSKVISKLDELGLPRVVKTDLETATSIPVINFELTTEIARFESGTNSIRQSKISKKKTKGISVWDFDDTLAKTKSKILYKDENGRTIKITPTQFAEFGDALLEKGIVFDFSEFTKIVKGKKGPLFDKAVKRNEKFGNEHVYILTARPQASAHAIHIFLKEIGLDIKLENITGLEDSNPQAKADWIMGKVGEGYNDFYFADDHIGNIDAVKEILKDTDVKSKVVQAKMDNIETINPTFLEMLERTGGERAVGIARKKVAEASARHKGRKFDRSLRGKSRFFVPPEAEDFVGLLYKFLGKGKQGDADFQFFLDNLINPYIKGKDQLDVMNSATTREYNAVIKKHKGAADQLSDQVPAKMITQGGKKINILEDFTWDMAVRYYLYERAGHGEMLSESVGGAEALGLFMAVQTNPQMLAFAKDVGIASRQKEGYSEPDAKNWETQSIATDFKGFITDTHRAAMIADFIENAAIIFDAATMNKIQEVHGTRFKNALEGVIARMTSGTKNQARFDTTTSKALAWINGAIAKIMFLNVRSGVLQALSITNFINWTDNNPVKMAAAMANIKQFTADFSMIWNSPKLEQRRAGLRFTVETAELANMRGVEGLYQIWFKKMVKAGFFPTQMVDSFAIAVGGASFYRNRVNSNIKQGMTQKEAEDSAWVDFSKAADEAQQSSDQMMTSAEQSGGIGRILLAFSNTPAQYARLTKKAILDIKNGRGDIKTNLSKIAYYGFVQHLIFAALQNALFFLWNPFEDDDEEEKVEQELYVKYLKEFTEMLGTDGEPRYTKEVAETKAQKQLDTYIEARDKKVQQRQYRTINSVADSALRGVGARGAIIASLKNAVVDYFDRSDLKENSAAVYEAKRILLQEAVAAENWVRAEELQEEIKDLSSSPMLDFSNPLLTALSVSPPLSDKMRGLKNMMTNEHYNRAVILEKGWAYDSPRWQTIALGGEFLTNIPLSWPIKKLRIAEAWSQEQTTELQKLAMLGGWSPYDVGLDNEEWKAIKKKEKLAKADERSLIRKEGTKIKKYRKDIILKKRTLSEVKADEKVAKLKGKESAAKAAKTRTKNKKKTQLDTYEETLKYADTANVQGLLDRINKNRNN